MTGTQSYHSKVTPIGVLHVEKIAEAVLLYILRMPFPASLFLPPTYCPVDLPTRTMAGLRAGISSTAQSAAKDREKLVLGN